MSMLRWLHLGMSIKRWIVFLVAGLTLIGLSAGYVLQSFHLSAYLPSWARPLTLQFLPHEERGGLFLAVGVAITVIALVRLNRTVIRLREGAVDVRAMGYPR